ncbi:helix-turn-helix domain-containing protein [Dyadobacter luticola]|uniref:Helix-turn-helix domain-containing protein n=1 Tax=Dyadobacter luticola TaxID=1979387 RepID=A0A5R9L4P6_9BACT|nr:helix-turn-helix domain-containing protein [Dyadobacter luticola]TLV03250.1 helix-turn-helix domain-containing protein [Dyadobacter luticola]
MQTTFPRLDIGPLSDFRSDDMMVSRFADYLEAHQNLVFPHRHSFYHMVLFTEGSGYHTIDFHRFEVVPYQIYFMVPGQVHAWYFAGKMDGYVVNFSDTFFRSFLHQPDYLESFSFFDGDASHAVVDLDVSVGKSVVALLEVLVEQAAGKSFLREDMIRALLLQVFLTIEQSRTRDIENEPAGRKGQVVRDFKKLIETHFHEQRLPGAYASMLNLTPNHLNAICKERLGIQAGEMIRNRIILEAKRLLVNLDLTISQISDQLNFSDNSYFSKFFKKEAGITPEEFRKRSVA